MIKTIAAAATALALTAGALAASAQPLLPDIRPYAVTMSVPDLEATVAWYGEILGFTVERRNSYPEFGTRLAFLRRDAFRIELIEDANARPGIPRPDAPAHTATYGISQFMFGTDDLADVRRRLAERGIHPHFEFENAELGVRFFFIRDPNVNLIAFIQRL
ncbi:VOC family protein [Roseomonas sp. CCTCC AB2023176]|uniref:VOC family protein n=1 Tax=Roseomonas sp. CCTCC AB2023176 TaxID=3342640 RepID=UPI0035E2C0DB